MMKTDAANADDVVNGLDLSSQRAVVTGANSGLGEEIARVLASAGAEVVLAVRNASAGAAAANRIRRSTPTASVRVAELDLMSPSSVAGFAAAWEGPLNVLVANGGIMATPEARSVEGVESQMMTNYLAHFALAARLQPALAASGRGRLVLASSNAHLLAPVDLDDPNFERRAYEPWSAYAQSKTALILFALEAQRRWGGDGLTVSAYNPGFVRTNLQKHMPAQVRDAASGGISVTEGAAMPVFLAASPAAASAGGWYYENMEIAAPALDEERDMSRPETFRGVASYAQDPATAAALWNWSLKATASW